MHFVLLWSSQMSICASRVYIFYMASHLLYTHTHTVTHMFTYEQRLMSLWSQCRIRYGWLINNYHNRKEH